MKKNSKKLLALVMVLAVLVTTLAGCGGNSGAGDSTASTTGAASQPGQAGAAPVEISMFVNQTWWPLKDWSGPIPEEITKETGVKLNITVAADEKQLSLLIASGDLPEMIYDSDTFSRLSNSELCYDWNGLIQQYAPDFKPDDQSIAMNTAKDGKFYTILNYFATQEQWESTPKALNSNAPGIAFRKDMLEQLGNPQIKTLDDLDKVLGMAKEKFPGVVPMIMNTNWKGVYQQSSFLQSQFGVRSDGFVLDGQGKVIHSIRQPQRLDFYKLLNSYYRKGYIVPDNFTFKNEDESFAYAYNGKAFSYQKGGNIAKQLNTELEKQGKDFTFVLQTNMISDKARFYNSSAGWSGMYITRKCQHPEEAINFVKFMFTDKGMKLGLWGVEGKDWTMNQEGYPEFKYNRADEKYINSQGLNWWGLLGDNAVVEALAAYDTNDKESTDYLTETKRLTVYTPALALLRPEADSQENAISSKLDEMIRNEEIKIILSKSDDELQKSYDNMMSLAEKIGLSKLEAWANTRYGEVSKLFDK